MRRILFVVLICVTLPIAAKADDATQFKFENYSGRGAKQSYLKALEITFPLGTPKWKVDQILVDQNGAEVTMNQGWNDFSYQWPKPETGIDGHVIHFKFDKLLRTKWMSTGKHVFYGQGDEEHDHR